MRLEGRNVVPFAPVETWRRLVDPEVLRRCTPGLERLEVSNEDRFEAVLSLKLPAVQGRFEGTVEFVERAPPERLRLRVSGKGAPGFVEGDALLCLAAEGEGTAITWQADLQVGGTIGRLGQRMLAGVSREMAGQFFEAFARPAAKGPHSAALPPWRAFLQLLWRSLLRLLGTRRGP